MLKTCGIAMGTIVAVWATSSAAQVSSTGNDRASTPASVAAKGSDPNRVICVTEDVIGSRLGGKKVCRTTTEWLAYRSEIRGTVDRVQAAKMTDQNSAMVLRSMTTPGIRP